MNLATLVVSISEKEQRGQCQTAFSDAAGQRVFGGLEHFGEFVSDSVLALTYALPWLVLLVVVIAAVRAVVGKKTQKKSQKILRFAEENKKQTRLYR